MGLPITPKVHIVEDHGWKKGEEMDEKDIAFFFTIEEFVEHNHQLGHKQEERVKRIPNAETRATSKVERNWLEINPKVQEHNKQVANMGSRGPYKTEKKRKLAEMSQIPPSPFRPDWEMESYADLLSDYSMSDEEFGDFFANNQFTPPSDEQQPFSSSLRSPLTSPVRTVDLMNAFGNDGGRDDGAEGE